MPEKAKRRHFSAAYKSKILKEAARCGRSGELGALLRREGLYSSNLSKWRRQAEAGRVSGLLPKKRGPKAAVIDERDKRITRLEREIQRLSQRAERAEALVMPFNILDEPFGGGTYADGDMAEALRLEVWDGFSQQ